MVETTGVEPVVPCGRRIYSPLGLPIFLHLHKLGARDGTRARKPFQAAGFKPATYTIPSLSHKTWRPYPESNWAY